MKKGLTFAELMICLVVVSVITAVLYPMVAQFNPNVNKPLAKSAYKTLTGIVAEIVNDPQVSPTGTLPDTAAGFCTAFCEKANVLPEVMAGATVTACAGLCDDNKIQTSNGMRWFFNGVRSVVVDVNASNNTLANNAENNIANIWNPGSFYYPDATMTPICNRALNVRTSDDLQKLKVQDTFQFVFNEKGTINNVSPTMWEHLEDKSADY